MRAAIYHAPLNITTEEVEQPRIDAKGVVIRVRACGICGSDLHLYRLGLFAPQLCRSSDQGPIPGHEFSGEIVEVGTEVKGLAVGDRVVAYTSGGMAEYVPVSPALAGLNVHKILDSIPHRIAATLEPLSNSLHAVLKGRPAEGETAVVFGVGIIGLGVIQCLKALDLGLKQIIAVDVSPNRLALAQSLGADAIINASSEDVVTRTMELTGESQSFMGSGFGASAADVVFDCVGLVQERPEPPVLQHAIDIARPGTGRIVVHGVFEAPVKLELTTFVAKQITILGSYGMTPAESEQAVQLIESGRIDRDVLITGEFPLDQAGAAFDAQMETETNVKVIINP